MPYRPKIKNSDGTITDIPLEAETAVKLKTSRSIGLSGVTATSQSFNGTSAITIPVTAVPISLVTGLLDKTYPVGSIYMSTSSTSPASLFGGTWTVWGAGRVPVSVNISDVSFYTSDLTGGEKQHLLTSSEMPKHTHTQNSHNHTQNSHNHGINLSSLTTNSAGEHSHDIRTDHSDPEGKFDCVTYRYEMGTTLGSIVRPAGSHTHSFSISGKSTDSKTATNNSTTATNNNTGGDIPHNNLQPFITCYMWKRTA